MARTITATRSIPVEAADRVVFADAALALAGHEVTDPALRTILERQARQVLTGDEARDAIRRHVQG